MAKVQNPLVTVIIPTKNRVSYLVPAIESVLHQTFRDFEILVVDGSSTDVAKVALSKFHDNRIRYLPQNNSVGASTARNLGISQAQGQFIGFLDDDDLWLHHKLEKQVALIRQNTGPSVVYSSCSYVIRSDGKVIGIYRRPRVNGNLYPTILKGDFIGNCSSVLVKKECFAEEVFDVNLPAVEDWDLWIRLAKKFCFQRLDEPLDAYRLHKKRLTRSYLSVLQAYEKMFKKYYADIASSPNSYELLRRWHLLLGLANVQFGDKKHARNEYATAIRINPYCREVYFRFLSSFFGPEPYNSAQMRLEHILIGRTLRQE